MAVTSLVRALALAREEEDRWREYKCLTWLAMQQHELGLYSEVAARCAELRTVANRLGEDETPFVATLQALASLAADQAAADDLLPDALRHLRKVDDKSYLAYALNSAASLHLRAGRIEQARTCAAEALAAASTMRRQDEIVISRALLARADHTTPTEGVEAVVAAPADWNRLSARARAKLQESAGRAVHSNGDSHDGRKVCNVEHSGDDTCPTSSSSAASRSRLRRRNSTS